MVFYNLNWALYLIPLNITSLRTALRWESNIFSENEYIRQKSSINFSKIYVEIGTIDVWKQSRERSNRSKIWLLLSQVNVISFCNETSLDICSLFSLLKKRFTCMGCCALQYASMCSFVSYKASTPSVVSSAISKLPYTYKITAV